MYRSVICKSTELEEKLSNGLFIPDNHSPQTVVMIQCVGSRNDEMQECSRICCQAAVKNALLVKKASPDTQVFVLYRDMRTYGLMEDYLTEAREKGVIFIRFDADTPPVVEASSDGM